MTVHATCVRIERAGMAFGAPRDAGVLLMGPSGSGKSDVALRLIAMGARLVADDRTELFIRNGRLFGRAPKNIAGLLEVRGVGIVKVPQALQARIALAVDLVADEKVQRLPEQKHYRPKISALSTAAPVPQLALSADISAPEKILAAIAGFSRGMMGDW